MKTDEQLISYSQIPLVSKYIELILADDLLWEEFQMYLREFIKDRDSNFFGYNRTPECADIWRSMVDNMGGGLPLSFYASAAFLLLRYQENGHDLDGELERINSRRDNKVCPKCGSWRVAPILYGMPVMDDEMQQAISNQEMYIGGCKELINAPAYHCYACRRNFGKVSNKER